VKAAALAAAVQNDPVTELLDIIHPDGTPTGVAKERAAAHRDGDWHRAAHLWIVTTDLRVLLQRRALTKDTWPGLWDVSVAGHVAAGELPEEAIIREAFEELGLEIEAEELRHLGTLRYQAVLHGGSYLENELHEVFLLRRDLDPLALALDEVEVAEVALVAPDGLSRFELVPHPESYALLRSVLT
jgi:isopentenyl-diphosphate Delta-isomerase